MREYLNTGVYMAKGSDLQAAVDAKDSKLAAKIFKETSANYAKLYSKEDREWFANFGKPEANPAPENETDAEPQKEVQK